MSVLINQIMEANRAYADNFGEKASLPMPPGKNLAILTCMDARLAPLGFAGLDLGDAHIIRNAGGRATDDAIRSLVISHKLLGTREWMVIHHTDCGMETFTGEIMRGLLESSLGTARFDGKRWVDEGEGTGSTEGGYIEWLAIKDQAASIRADMNRIRNHPLVPDEIGIHGYLFDVKTGLLGEVG